MSFSDYVIRMANGGQEHKSDWKMDDEVVSSIIKKKSIPPLTRHWKMQVSGYDDPGVVGGVKLFVLL